MTGRTSWPGEDEEGVTVAVDSDLDDFEVVAASAAFDPELLPGA